MGAMSEKKPIEFLKSRNNLFRDWQVCQGYVCEIENLTVSLDRAPPPLACPAPQPSAPADKVQPPSKPPEKIPPEAAMLDTLYKAVQAKRRFFKWMDSPAPPVPPAQPKAPPPPATPASRVPPFDIQDVPKAMDKLSMPMSAKLQRRWFAGYANEPRSMKETLAEIDQNGVRYAPAMVDDKTITMDWVLQFPRAREAFEQLVRNGVRDPAARVPLRNALLPYRNRLFVRAWEESKGDLLHFHQSFQFQLIKVNSSFGQRISNYLVQAVVANGVPDDLTGALGSFSFFAAVDFAQIDRQRNEASVSHIWVYVRDSYDFADDQYLGHWSASHVAVVPFHHAAGGNGWLEYPVAHGDGDVRLKGNVLYPVTNKHYRDWRLRHRQGGDFMIYTDRLMVALNPPIKVPL